MATAFKEQIILALLCKATVAVGFLVVLVVSIYWFTFSQALRCENRNA